MKIADCMEIIEECLTNDQGNNLVKNHQENVFNSVKRIITACVDTNTSIENTLEVIENTFKTRHFDDFSRYAKQKNGSWWKEKFSLPEDYYTNNKEKLNGLVELDKNGEPKVKTTGRKGSCVIVKSVPSSWYSSTTTLLKAIKNSVDFSNKGKSQLEKELKSIKQVRKVTVFEEVEKEFCKAFKLLNQLSEDSQKIIETNIDNLIHTRTNDRLNRD